MPAKHSHVYLFAFPRDNLLRIGKAADPWTRLSQLTHSWGPLEREHSYSIRVASLTASKNLERALQKLLDNFAHHARRENPPQTRTIIMEQSPSIQMWHGGNLDQQTSGARPKGTANSRWEHGPGLYLTTRYETAAEYAKGGKKLYLLTINKGRSSQEVTFPVKDALPIVRSIVPKQAQERVLSDLGRNGRSEISAEVLLNVLINSQAVKNSKKEELREFLVEKKVDYTLVQNPGGWDATMMVLYNPKLVSQTRVVSRSEKIKTFDLPRDFSIPSIEPAGHRHVYQGQVSQARFSPDRGEGPRTGTVELHTDTPQGSFNTTLENLRADTETAEKLIALAGTRQEITIAGASHSPQTAISFPAKDLEVQNLDVAHQRSLEPQAEQERLQSIGIER